MITINLHYTKEIVKDAVGYYFRRKFWSKFPVLLPLVVFILATDLFIDDAWYRAFTISPLIILGAFFWLGYRGRLRRSLAKFEDTEDCLTMTLTDSTVATESAMGKSELKWKGFTELWEFPSTYLLLLRSGTFFILPKNQISADAINFIQHHLKPAA